MIAITAMSTRTFLQTFGIDNLPRYTLYDAVEKHTLLVQQLSESLHLNVIFVFTQTCLPFELM